MEPEYTSSENIFNRSPKQEKIIQKLNRLVGPGSATFYEDACWLIKHEPHLPSTTHLVSHLLREIDSALMDVLKPLSISVPIIDEGNDQTQRDRILLILSALDIEPNDQIAKAWLKVTGLENVKGLHARAHRNNLAKARPVDKEFFEFWITMEKVLYEVLTLFETKYIDVLNQLDVLRKKNKPTKEEANILKKHIPNNVASYGYFFTNLNNSEWLGPLFRVGIFSSPTEPIENKQEGTISFPQWPQSRYLLAMASHKPKLVSEIILTIDTKNVSILADLLDAIYQFPASLAAKHVEKICQWEINVPFLFGDKIGSLVSHLSQGKETTGAALLTKEFLRLRPSKKLSNAKETKKVSYFIDEPQPIVDKWEYSEFLKNNFPAFYKAAPREALSTVINALADALRLYPYEKIDDYLDYSEFWRPAIEDNSQNHGYQDPRYELVTAIRNSAEYYLTQNPHCLEEILHEFETMQWTIFKRFALHFSRIFNNQNFKLAESYILDKTLFTNVHTHHEYVCLVKELFSKLDKAKQRKFLGWIKAGPKIQSDEENPTKIKEWWQLRWLTILKGQLPPPWEKTRRSLLNGMSEPENPDFLHSMGEVMMGPTSPITVEELKVMSIDDIVAYLNSWKMPAGFTMDSPEGVSRTLATAISEDSERFAYDAEKFIGCDPTYVHGIFSGLKKALEAEKLFNWLPVIKLMNWVVSQERAISGREVNKAWDQDPDWGWTRTVIAGLLEKGFSSQKNQIPYSEELEVWKILQPLTDDPNPTGAEDSETGMGPAMQSINTTRGTAFHSLVSFALWKKRNILNKKLKNIDEISLSNDLPEVLTVLEKHLDPIYDSSPSIRAVYGWRFPNLAYVDHKWAIANKDRIFPKKVEDLQFWDAAWSSCVGFNGASKNMLKDLYEEYLYSISTLSSSPMKTEMGNNPNERLVEHLILYYAWNDIELDCELITTFWSNSTPELRSIAIRFIGKAEKGLSVKVINRLKQLWETRFQVILNAEVKDPFIEELKAFGWIFVSTSFNDEWVLNQLEKVLTIISETDNDHGVSERLAILSEKNPHQTVRLMERLVTGDKKGWRSSLWKNNIKMILSSAILSNDSEAKKEAVVFINRLAALGFTDYINLLEPEIQ